MSIGPWQIAIIVLLIVLIFGSGRISSLMGDVAKGIQSFRKNMAEGAGDDDKDDPLGQIAQDSEPVDVSKKDETAKS